MKKINFHFNENGGVRIDQEVSLREKARSYDALIHTLPADFHLRNDFQTLSKLYDRAVCSGNAAYAHEFEILKTHLLSQYENTVEIEGGK